MVAMVFTENKEIQPITIDENASLTTSDHNRLFRAHCSYLKFMKFIDEVPEAEQQRKRLEEEQKEKVVFIENPLRSAWMNKIPEL